MMKTIALIVVVLLALPNTTQGIIGMNWGRVSAHRLLPTQVVDLLLQNGIKHARVYSSEEDILSAFAGSGIDLTIGIGDPTLFANNVEAAKFWIRLKEGYFKKANAKRVILGDTVFSRGLNDKSMIDKAIQSLQATQTALDEAKHPDVKATFTHNVSVLKPYISQPSNAEFLDEVKEQMITLVRFLEAHDSPFLVNMFPISDNKWLNFTPSFAFPDNKSEKNSTDSANGFVYKNVFEFVYDSFIWALGKINASKLHVIVSQVGWPTDGYEGANATAAERFFKSLLPLVASNKGTPMRPGAPIDTFIHGLADEHKMPLYYTYPFTRHWGIYRSNGLPKYKVDLSGQGRDIYPTEVKGIMRMPQRWCVYNVKNHTELNKVQSSFDNACKIADCTSMSPGGSCSQLTFDQNISYAFNAVFQYYFQDEKACDFGGFGYVTTVDPSTPECMFPVEVVRGQQKNYVPAVAATSSQLHHTPKSAIFLAFLLSILATFS